MRRATIALLLLTACASVAARHRSGALIREADARFRVLTPAANEAAIALYRRAVELDPGAAANAGLAEALAQHVFWNRRDKAALDESVQASAAALQIDPGLPRAHFARAFALGLAGRPKEASRAYLETLARDPDYPRAVHYALGQLWRAGRYDEAYRWSLRQLEKEPRSVQVLFNSAVTAGFLLDVDRGEALMRRALEIDPHFGVAHGELAFFAQARGRQDEAVAHMEAAVRDKPGDALNVLGLAQMLIPAGRALRARQLIERVLTNDRTARAYGGRSGLTIYGWALQELGENDAANRVFDEMLANLASREQSGETSYQLYREMAAIHAIRGERTKGLRAAAKAVDSGWHLYGSHTMPDPMFRSLAGDREFEELLERMRADIVVMRGRVGLPPLP